MCSDRIVHRCRIRASPKPRSGNKPNPVAHTPGPVRLGRSAGGPAHCCWMGSPLYRPRALGSSADEEVDVATDLVHASLVDGAEVALDAVVGQGPDPLCHSNEN